jgi:hypothetical protein
MGRLSLARDATRGFYCVPGMIQKRLGAPIGSGSPFVNFEMFVDTGSNQTTISEDVAREVGIDIAKCERRGASGIGGLAKMPVVPKLELWLLEPAEGPVLIRLPQISIMENRELHERQVRGPLVRSRDSRSGGLNLLGLDALIELKATLTVRPHESYASLEW